MTKPKLFLGLFALALILPLLLLACGGSDEPTDRPSSERATAAPEGSASSWTDHRGADNGKRRTVAHACGHRRADICGHRRAPDGADLVRNGPGSVGRLLQRHRRPKLE